MRMKTLEHQWLHVLFKRGGGDGDEARNLQRLKSGYEGECDFDDWLERFGRQHWKVFKDIWIDAGGITQIDTMVITGEGIYVFDVKNYSGDLEYIDGKWFSDGKRLNKDIFIQLKRSMEKVGVMHRRMGARGALRGMIVFTNAHSDVRVMDDVDVAVVRRSEIKRKIQQLVDGENWNDVLDIGRTAQAVEAFTIDCPYKPRELEDLEFDRLMKGICCGSCGGFLIEVGRYHVRCRCGHVEPKEKAVLRTICEYGVLRHERDLKVGEVHQFLEGAVTKKRVSELLGRHFKLIDSGRYAKYENPCLEYEFLFKGLEFYYD